MREKSATLITAEKSTRSTPYVAIKLSDGVATTTYASNSSSRRLKSVKHVEEPYSDWAVVVLSNSDKTLPNYEGYRCLIDYGYIVSSVTYTPTPTGPAPLWVVKQFQISREGNTDIILYLEGAWGMLRRRQDIAELLGGVSPYYTVEYTGSTIYDIIEAVLAAANFDLLALGIHDDSIIDTLQPEFGVNSLPFEDATELIYRLLNMTKCMIRAERAAWAVPYNAPDSWGGGKWYDLFNVDKNIFYDPVTKLEWVFYGGTPGGFQNLYHRTSYDNFTAVVTDVVASSHIFHVYFDGTYLHVAYNSRMTVDNIYYRRATLNANGTITWSTEYWYVLGVPGETPYGTGCGLRDICADTNHYPYISYLKFHQGAPFWTDLYVAKANQNDGTVISYTDTILEDRISDQACLHSLGDGDMLCVWLRRTDVPTYRVRCMKCISGTWTSVVIKSSMGGTGSNAMWSTSNKAGKVYVVCESWVYNGAGSTHFQIWDKSTGAWSADEDLSLAYGYVLRLCVDTNGDIIMFWLTTGAIYYKKRSAIGVWEANWTLVKSWTHDIHNIYGLWVQGQVVDGHLGVLYSVDHYIYPSSHAYYLYYIQVGDNAYLEPPAGTLASFKVIYPAYWSTYHATYTSDRPDATYHQFKEFEWRDHLLIPSRVYVTANKVLTAEGNWSTSDIITGDSDNI